MLNAIKSIALRATPDPRKLWRRYLAAIVLVAGLVGGSHAVQYSAINLSYDDANSINIAGRQRMLSQRIMFLTLDLQRTDDPAAVQDLTDAIQLFARSHQQLISLPSMDDALRDHYFGQTDLDGRTRDYIADAQMILAARANNLPTQATLGALIEEGRAPLLNDLDQAVTLLEQAATERVDNTLSLAQQILMIAIFVIVLEALLIFVPAQVSVNATLDALQIRNDQIEDQKQALERTARELEFAAYHDPLTGLANRKLLFEVLDKGLDTRLSAAGVLTAMQIDLDHFKQINDTHGHPAGDAVLQTVAHRLVDTAKDALLISRIGGDELVIVCRSGIADAPQSALMCANQIIDAIEAPIRFEGKTLHIGASIGIAFATSDIDNSDALLALADEALYNAKDEGRGTARIYDLKESDVVNLQTWKASVRHNPDPSSASK